MRKRIRDRGVTVHVRGRVTPAEHVYAHDRVDRLRRIVPDDEFRSTVSIVADGVPGAAVSASGEVHVHGQVALAEAEGSTIRNAIDLLDERLRRCIEIFGNRKQEGR